MKKALSIAVIIALIFSAVSTGVSAQGSQPELGFAVASDLHYNLPGQTLEKTNDDPVFWYASRRAAMDNESGFIIDEFLKQCAENDSCEYVLISGDLADNGRTVTDEHYAVAQKLRLFEQQTGKQVFVIDGNHDLGNGSNTDAAAFKEIYSEFGYDRALTVDGESCSYTANLGEKYRLIALDSCDYDASTKDGMTLKKLQWVKAEAAAAKKDGRYPILMMHHNLLDRMPAQSIFSKNFIVKNHYSTAEFFADCGIKLVFSGHEHCSDAAKYTSALGNVIYDFATTALTMYPLQYRLFTLSDFEISYKAKTIEKLDTAALSSTVEGYTPEQLALMNSGLNSYSLGFFKAGIQYRLALSLTPEKLGIAEDDVYYELIMAAVDTLTDLLKMPLYGENSAQELAKNYGIDIPDSSYTTGWDAVTSLASEHYAGEEAYALDSTEVTLLLKTAALLLRTERSAISDELFLGAGKKILDGLGAAELADKLTQPVKCGVTPCEYLLFAVASPLLYGFAYDDDGVNDNNGTVPGYGTADFSSNVENLGLNIRGFFERLIQYFRMLMSCLFKAE